MSDVDGIVDLDEIRAFLEFGSYDEFVCFSGTKRHAVDFAPFFDVRNAFLGFHVVAVKDRCHDVIGIDVVRVTWS